MEDIRGEGEKWWDCWVEWWKAKAEPENGVGIWAYFSSALRTRRITWHGSNARHEWVECSPSLTNITPVQRAGSLGERLRKTPCGLAVRRPLLRPRVRNGLVAQSQRHPTFFCILTTPS